MNETVSHTQWLLPVLVLGGAFVVAFVWVLLTRKRTTPASLEDDVLADLERKAQNLVDQLRELNQDRHHLGEADFLAEKARLERAAAEALRARDLHLQAHGSPGIIVTSASAEGSTARASAGTPAVPPATPVPAPAAVQARGWFGRHPQLAGAFWGGGVVLFFVVLGIWLSGAEHPRTRDETITGTVGHGDDTSAQAAAPSAQPSQGMDDQLKAALAEVTAHPEKVRLAAEVSHDLIAHQEMKKAQKVNRRSLAYDPFNPELRAHRALFAAMAGHVDQARKALEHVGDIYPGGQEALLYLGMISLQSGDNAGALDDFERYAAMAPKGQFPEHLREGILQLRQIVAQKAQPTDIR